MSLSLVESIPTKNPQLSFIFRQRVKFFSFVFNPILHCVWGFHQFSHFIHCINMCLVTSLKHFHSVHFALLSNFFKTGCMKLFVTCSTQLFTSHCFHNLFLAFRFCSMFVKLRLTNKQI